METDRYRTTVRRFRSSLRISLMTLLGVSLFLQTTAAQQTDEIIDRMIAAHGGMADWKAAPTISFTDEFRPGAAKEGMPSHVVVEQGSRRAYIDYPDTKMKLTWDGKQCWTENWQLPTPPRFLAQLNYYFLNLPWLVKDKGVVLGEPGTQVLPGDPAEYISIHMGFEATIGDTPEDYYILYIDPDSYRLHGYTYIVTYKDALPEGILVSPEHLLVFDELVQVEGLHMPSHYTIYDLDHNVYATCAVRDWSLQKPFDESRMQMPEGAVIDTSQP